MANHAQYGRFFPKIGLIAAIAALAIGALPALGAPGKARDSKRKNPPPHIQVKVGTVTKSQDKPNGSHPQPHKK